MPRPCWPPKPSPSTASSTLDDGLTIAIRTKCRVGVELGNHFLAEETAAFDGDVVRQRGGHRRDDDLIGTRVLVLLHHACAIVRIADRDDARLDHGLELVERGLG